MNVVVWICVIYALSFLLCYPYHILFYKELRKTCTVDEIKSVKEFFDWISKITDGALPLCSYIPVVNTLIASAGLGYLAAYCALKIENKLSKIWKQTNL